MLILPGSNALSAFRTNGLLSRLQAVDNTIVGVTARFIHFVDVASALSDAEMQRLKENGVRFLSEPASVTLPGAPMTSRFVCFFDPDGTVLELVENKVI